MILAKNSINEWRGKERSLNLVFLFQIGPHHPPAQVTKRSMF
jgi:hypothetical protein